MYLDAAYIFHLRKIKMLKRIGKDARNDFCRRIIEISARHNVVHKLRYTFGTSFMPRIIFYLKADELHEAVIQGDLTMVKFYRKTLQWQFTLEDASTAMDNGNFDISTFIWKHCIKISPDAFLDAMGKEAFRYYADKYPWRADDIIKSAFSRNHLEKLQYAQQKYPSEWRKLAIYYMFKNAPHTLGGSQKFTVFIWMLRYSDVVKDIDIDDYVRFFNTLANTIITVHTDGDTLRAQYLYELLCALDMWVYLEHADNIECMTESTCTKMNTTTSRYGALIRETIVRSQCECKNAQNH